MDDHKSQLGDLLRYPAWINTIETMDLERGIQKSLKYAAVGFAIPVVVLGTFSIYHFTFHDIHPMDRANDLARLLAMMIIPSLGLAILFGLSAFGSFAPNKGMSFMRSLIVVAGATLIAVFVTQPRIRRKTVDPDAWPETAIPIAVACIATIAVLLYKKWLPPHPVGGDQLNSKPKPNREITKR